jgi:general stress protein YciG
MEMVEKGNISVREAGRKGGMATSKTHGHEFYEAIGHKGGSKGGQRVRELIERGKESESGRRRY